LSLKLNTGATSVDSMSVIIRIRSMLTIRSNMNTLFGLLFGPNRIQIEYSVQPYQEL